MNKRKRDMKKLLTLLFLACLTLTAAGETPKKFLVLWGQNGRPKIVYDLKERPQVLMTANDLTVIRNGVETVYDKDDVIRFTYESVVPMTQPGDANGDGQVSITDVTTSVSHAQGESPRMFSEEAVDFNGDGRIDDLDIRSIISILLGIPLE